MSRKKIFIIDDDDAAIFGYSRYLEKSGYVVSASAFLKEGLEKLSQENFDAVVFDVRLPDGNALDVIPQVRARNKAIKIFVISGLSDEKTCEAALAGGADEFLVKPIAIKDLCESISKTLENAA